MIVRRYVVNDMPEAVLSIRRDLGNDAVILSTKKIKVKKWLGLRWQTKLEVTAAVGADIPMYQPNVSGTQTRRPNRTAEPEKTDAVVGENERSDVQKTVSSLFEAHQTPRAPQSTNADDAMKQVLAELTSLKTMMTNNHQIQSEPLSARTACAEWLREQGLREVQIDAWMDTAAMRVSAGADIEMWRQAVCEVGLERLAQFAEPSPINTKSRIVTFIGPTGVGKTTSIAKIASLHVLAGKRRIGLLTTDTFRIAAVQQLQIYADILSVPMVVAEDNASIGDSLASLRDCDLILVDTAGRNFREEKTVADTKELLTLLQPDETILVLALTAKAQDVDRLVGVCEPLAVDKLLFTKMDETDTLGTIPSIVEKYHLPMSYITTGQNVPHDIDIFSMQDLFARLCQEDDHT
ncbi:flagellar biosynthesis protein FlhF [Alicyclobacillus fodiniaquatilis]|jgi:flagellar biosynthesis protein FlhF|uniref:Flagellar biosynthesis protein FlhF n=1 Tax=Alicyclobacillus fodiniaquatilis TaxID=1661150 RepID=A0ABW4JFG7_9BACL